MKYCKPYLGSGLFASILAAGVMIPSNTWAQQGGNYRHMWDGGWHGWFFGPLMMILLIGLIVAAVVFLVRRGDGQEGSSDQSRSETPVDILKKRFARGEIDKEEFEERRRALEK